MDFGKGYLTTLRFYFIHNRSFLDFIEEYIKKTVDSFDDEYTIDEDLKIENPDFYYFLVDDLSEKWWQYSRDFPGEFRATLLSQLYSGMDSHLHKICERFHKIHHPPKTVKEMSGRNEWAQKAKYLKKYAGVDFSTLQTEWDFLNAVRMIRNQIVHHHSSISANTKDWPTVRKFIADNPGLIEFKDDVEEKDEEGSLLYKKYPDHYFEFLINHSDMNKLILKISESFFNKLIPKISFKKPV
jgi:hypothetical protein